MNWQVGNNRINRCKDFRTIDWLNDAVGAHHHFQGATSDSCCRCLIDRTFPIATRPNRCGKQKQGDQDSRNSSSACHECCGQFNPQQGRSSNQCVQILTLKTHGKLLSTYFPPRSANTRTVPNRLSSRGRDSAGATREYLRFIFQKPVKSASPMKTRA